MNYKIRGKILVAGDNIDTDQIYPGRFLAITDPTEIGRHCFGGMNKNIASSFPQGGIVVAGRKFGCGSSREHAPIALLNMGAAAVIADSFARIFYRNAVNLGLVPVISHGLSKKVNQGQTLTLDLQSCIVKVHETGEIYPCEPPGDLAMKILEAGGMKAFMNKKLRNV